MIIAILYTLFFAWFLQEPMNVPVTRWLVELKSTDATCLDQWWSDNGFDTMHYLRKNLPVDHWLVVGIPEKYRQALIDLPCVGRIEPDLPIEWRNTVPNDPMYINQGDMNLIGMPKAWDYSTGGMTIRGDTIVVAVIDNGFDVMHPDLITNIWVNRAEIPNDHIDNDSNGYIDDYRGLNILSGDDAHPVAIHGTQVSGIIGAQGNNSIGVTGVNWNIKLMLISGADFESEVIEAYQYVLRLRKKYNDSHGAEGAFVVVTNLSGGIDNAKAIDHPLWCEMYDKLGAEGILSVTAAPNHGVSVDIDGDMPTTCISPYMLAVTNVDASDVILSNAGFGSQSIDIGAPGEGTHTVFPNNQYKSFSGTSAAAPHVSGAIAWMYSLPCEAFFLDVTSDPDGVALRLKGVLLSSAKPNHSLQGITTTGKRVQVDAAAGSILSDCGVITDPGVQITSIYPNPVSREGTQIYFEIRGDPTDAFIDLYTTTGARVKHCPVTELDIQQGYMSIDTRPLPAAIYLVTLRNKDFKSTYKLFVL